ncbi:MAG: hypothetical protein ACREM8_00595 [Vulcanimicrobiaceae bacterium]
MSEPTFTLVLTKGTHLVSAAAAEEILGALAAREALVEVDLDLFGGASDGRRTTLATAHVVALSQNPAFDQIAAYGAQVVPMRRGRS